MKEKLKIEKKYLLITAGAVWLIAGFNIMRIGITAFNGLHLAGIICFGATVFLLFHNFVFRKMVKKHVGRIKAMEGQKHHILHFFDRKSYLIMACMITMGIGLRLSGLLSEYFITAFYTGLGFSLVIAGVSFGLHYLRMRRDMMAV